MRVVLVYPDIIKGANWHGYYYSGVGYLASSLLQAGHEVELAHITRRLNQQEFAEVLRTKLGPGNGQIVAFSATTNMFRFVEEWSGWAKKYFDVFTVAGGIHPTLSPAESIACASLDAICVGEGEAPLVELADAISGNKPIDNIANIWSKTNGRLVRNDIRPLVADLDSLPFPNRSLFDYANLDLESTGRGTFMAGRGCPYRCTYCCNDALVEVYGDRKKYVRFRSPANVIEEIDAVLSQFPFIRTIHFDDDILPLRPAWFEEFASLYKKKIGIPFDCNMRPNLVNEQVTSLLKDAGCVKVALGIESGDDEIRNKVLKRGLSRERMINACELLKSAGILVYSYNMVGLPFEGPKEMLETIKLNAEIGFDESQVSIFEPFPGTKLYDVCQDNNLTTGQVPTDYLQSATLIMPWAQLQQVLFFASFFRIFVKLYGQLYKLPGRFGSIGIRIADGFMSNRITAVTIFPVFNVLYRTIRRHRRLENVVRKTARKLLYRSES